MIIDNLTYNGQPVSLDIPLPEEDKPYFAKVSFIHFLLRQEFVFRSFEADATLKVINALYINNRFNPETDILENTQQGVFTSNPGDFAKFYLMPTGATPFGIVAARNLINGITFKTIGVRFFGSDLAPRQPVRYTLAHEGSTVTAAILDGIAPFQIKADTGEYIPGLSVTVEPTEEPTQRTIYVKDSAGTEFYTLYTL